ncbi:hypothetical protein GW17_00024787 [Ensete ventricosum]|nr:hypothetical protein GW17_00024787 [Ensete ventricosum]
MFIAWYGRYLPIRQVAGMRTARYRAVSPKIDRSKLASFSLKALREHYEIPLAGPAHRAMQDVTTLCYVLQRITYDLKLSVPELMNGAFRASDIIKIHPKKQDGAV